MAVVKICNRVIEYSFYALFLLVPLVFWKDTSELFELNKMWLTWGLTIVIAMAWIIKMIRQRRIVLQRTPLDIPIGLFLLSQIISTIFSLDPHVSFWGYYSRFNGGLLSTASYILLFYAFLSNFACEIGAIKMVKRLLSISLISGAIVALWGLPSHFGFDPTCLLFRGTFDVSCWTQDFMPKIRIFSTLGQPDWLAAYLAILIPISIAMALNNLRSQDNSEKKYYVSSIVYYVFRKNFIRTTCYILLATLFYVDLLYTRARSGFLAIWITIALFAVLYYWIERKRIKSSFIIYRLSFIIGILLLITFVIGTPIAQLNRFSLEGIRRNVQKIQAPKTTVKLSPTPLPVHSFESGGPARQSDAQASAGEGGTESGQIRLNVWTGAINAWKANPLFGTGVETFAFAYYKYKPATHNLTSEWNFLYNKAHNEYLNYLATTGIFGLGTYLLMIGSFFFLAIRQFKIHPFGKLRAKIKNAIQNSKLEKEKLSTSNSNFSLLTLNFALLAGYLSILVTNFFGFSVVITNIYLFTIPAFIFVLSGSIKTEPSAQSVNSSTQIKPSIWQWTPIFFVFVTGCWLLINLFRFWQADVAFALGYNLDRAGEYQQAYPSLHQAVKLRPGEPVFKDELALNDAIVATGLVSQKPRAAGIASGDARQDENTKEQTMNAASMLASEAINTTNEVISKHSNNVVFWKTRVRIFYTLSQVDSRYLPRALDAIEKVYLIAPQDANISYNLGVLYGQNGNLEKAIETMEKTVALKPNYRDARYALGLFYRQKADPGFQKKAVEQMEYILKVLSPKDQDAQKFLADWAK